MHWSFDFYQLLSSSSPPSSVLTRWGGSDRIHGQIQERESYRHLSLGVFPTTDAAPAAGLQRATLQKPSPSSPDCLWASSCCSWSAAAGQTSRWRRRWRAAAGPRSQPGPGRWAAAWHWGPGRHYRDSIRTSMLAKVLILNTALSTQLKYSIVYIRDLLI